jgi:hypothetical protein
MVPFISFGGNMLELISVYRSLKSDKTFLKTIWFTSILILIIKLYFVYNHEYYNEIGQLLYENVEYWNILPFLFSSIALFTNLINEYKFMRYLFDNQNNDQITKLFFFIKSSSNIGYLQNEHKSNKVYHSENSTLGFGYLLSLKFGFVDNNGLFYLYDNYYKILNKMVTKIVKQKEGHFIMDIGIENLRPLYRIFYEMITETQKKKRTSRWWPPYFGSFDKKKK